MMIKTGSDTSPSGHKVNYCVWFVAYVDNHISKNIQISTRRRFWRLVEEKFIYWPDYHSMSMENYVYNMIIGYYNFLI